MKEKNTVGAACLKSFFDDGTFVELGAYISRPGTEDRVEGVICGYGSVCGRLVFAFAQDGSLMKGAMDGPHAQKILRTYEKALSVGAPIVGFFDCAGAVVLEGAAALAGYGALLRTAARASGRIPQIAVINGVCAGTMAAVAALFDATVMVKDAGRLYVSSPTQAGEAVGTAETVFEQGNAALLAEDGAAASAAVRTLLSYLPDRAGQGIPSRATADDPNRAMVSEDSDSALKTMQVAVDAGSFVELYGGYGQAVSAGLASMGGICSVVIAMEGELDAASVNKMRRVTAMADRLGLPVVTFVNSTGVKSDAEAETEIAGALSELASVQVKATTPRVTALVGDAVGAGFIFGGSRALGADLVLALPDAQVAALNAHSAVAFLWNDRITPDCTREMLEREWCETVATPEKAAAVGEVDDIVAPAELRARLIAALFMLADKGTAPLEVL